MFWRTILISAFSIWCLDSAQAQSFATRPQPVVPKVAQPQPATPQNVSPEQAPSIETNIETMVIETKPKPDLPILAPSPEELAQAKKPLLDEIDYSAQTYPTQEKNEILRVINSLEKREKQRLQNIGSAEVANAPDGQHQVNVENTDDFKALLQDKFVPNIEIPKVKDVTNEQ